MIHWTRPRRDWILPPSANEPIEAIIRATADEFGLSVAEIKGKARRKRNIVPRQLAYWLARRDTDASLPEIGEAFDGRDHSTIAHGINATDARMTNNLMQRAERISVAAKNMSGAYHD